MQVHKKNEPGQKSIVTAIRIPNNKITSIENLYAASLKLVPEPLNIAWIDLSFNSIELVDKVLFSHTSQSILF
jgi:hypothetical protein